MPLKMIFTFPSSFARVHSLVLTIPFLLCFLWLSFSILSCLCPLGSLWVDSPIAYWGDRSNWMERVDGLLVGGLSFSRDLDLGPSSGRCQHNHMQMSLHRQISSWWYYCMLQGSFGCSWIYLGVCHYYTKRVLPSHLSQLYPCAPRSCH